MIRQSPARLAKVHQLNISSDHAFLTKYAHNISQRLKKDDRHTDKLEENILDHFNSYDEVMSDFNVPHALDANFRHSLLEDEAKIYYQELVQP